MARSGTQAENDKRQVVEKMIASETREPITTDGRLFREGFSATWRVPRSAYVCARKEFDFATLSETAIFINCLRQSLLATYKVDSLQFPCAQNRGHFVFLSGP